MAIRISNKNPLDVNQRVAIGVSIPFSSPSIFTSTYFTTEQIKSNIINYILTNTGERVLNPNFGANIQKQLFEQITPSSLSTLEVTLRNSIQSNFPTVKVNKITLTPIYEENTVQLSIDYSYLNNTAETINITL
jgi:phage baseplate assembly protein W